jgi:single-strand DNA-binding protein
MSYDMNLHIFGRLGSDPEARYTPNGNYVIDVPLAVNIGWGENKKTVWIKVVMWKKTAENFIKFAKKGTFVYLEGTPSVEVWKSKEGEPKGQLVLTAIDFKLLGGSKSREEAEEVGLTESQEDTQFSEEDDPF